MHLFWNPPFCASTVLWCRRCRIHRYVAAPRTHRMGDFPHLHQFIWGIYIVISGFGRDARTPVCWRCNTQSSELRAPRPLLLLSKRYCVKWQRGGGGVSGVNGTLCDFACNRRCFSCVHFCYIIQMESPFWDKFSMQAKEHLRHRRARKIPSGVFLMMSVLNSV